VFALLVTHRTFLVLGTSLGCIKVSVALETFELEDQTLLTFSSSFCLLDFVEVQTTFYVSEMTLELLKQKLELLFELDVIVDIVHREYVLLQDVVLELETKIILAFKSIQLIRCLLLEEGFLDFVKNFDEFLASDLIEQKMTLPSKRHQLPHPLISGYNGISHVNLDIFELVKLLLMVVADSGREHQLPFDIVTKYLQSIFEENAADHSLLLSLLHYNLLRSLLLPTVRVS